MVVRISYQKLTLHCQWKETTYDNFSVYWEKKKKKHEWDVDKLYPKGNVKAERGGRVSGTL